MPVRLASPWLHAMLFVHGATLAGLQVLEHQDLTDDNHEGRGCMGDSSNNCVGIHDDCTPVCKWLDGSSLRVQQQTNKHKG